MKPSYFKTRMACLTKRPKKGFAIPISTQVFIFKKCMTYYYVPCCCQGLSSETLATSLFVPCRPHRLVCSLARRDCDAFLLLVRILWSACNPRGGMLCGGRLATRWSTVVLTQAETPHACNFFSLLGFIVGQLWFLYYCARMITHATANLWEAGDYRKIQDKT